MKALTNLSRLLVGALFIFSGFIKANDPMGFGFKLEEYFEVFGMHFLIPAAMMMAIIICVSEVWLGILLLLGKRPKFTVVLLLGMIVFFTFLTFYSAYFDKVTDCGCFGDAIPLTPWQSFTKDLILLVLILILFKGQKHIQPLLPDGLTQKITWIGTAASIIFPLYTYRYLPVIDFRPYKIGADLVEQMKTIKQPDIQIVFIYEKNGETFEFDMNTLPSDLGTYTYVDRKENIIDPGKPAPIHDFVFTNDKSEEVTNVFLDKKGYKILSVQYDLERTDLSKMAALEDLASDLKALNVASFHISSGTKEQLATLNTSLTYYSGDKTMLKTVIRSNPGIVLFKDNVIVMKWPSTRFPSVEDIKKYMK